MGSRIKDNFPEKGGLFKSLQFCSERTNNIPQERAAVLLSTSVTSCSDFCKSCVYSQPFSAGVECIRNKADQAVTFLSCTPTGFLAQIDLLPQMSSLHTSPKRGKNSVQCTEGCSLPAHTQGYSMPPVTLQSTLLSQVTPCLTRSTIALEAQTPVMQTRFISSYLQHLKMGLLVEDGHVGSSWSRLRDKHLCSSSAHPNTGELSYLHKSLNEHLEFVYKLYNQTQVWVQFKIISPKTRAGRGIFSCLFIPFLSMSLPLFPAQAPV